MYPNTVLSFLLAFGILLSSLAAALVPSSDDTSPGPETVALPTTVLTPFMVVYGDAFEQEPLGSSSADANTTAQSTVMATEPSTAQLAAETTSEPTAEVTAEVTANSTAERSAKPTTNSTAAMASKPTTEATTQTTEQPSSAPLFNHTVVEPPVNQSDIALNNTNIIYNQTVLPIPCNQTASTLNVTTCLNNTSISTLLNQTMVTLNTTDIGTNQSTTQSNLTIGTCNYTTSYFSYLAAAFNHSGYNPYQNDSCKSACEKGFRTCIFDLANVTQSSNCTLAEISLDSCLTSNHDCIQDCPYLNTKRQYQLNDEKSDRNQLLAGAVVGSRASFRSSRSSRHHSSPPNPMHTPIPPAANLAFVKDNRRQDIGEDDIWTRVLAFVNNKRARKTNTCECEMNSRFTFQQLSSCLRDCLGSQPHGCVLIVPPNGFPGHPPGQKDSTCNCASQYPSNPRRQRDCINKCYISQNSNCVAVISHGALPEIDVLLRSPQQVDVETSSARQYGQLSVDTGGNRESPFGNAWNWLLNSGGDVRHQSTNKPNPKPPTEPTCGCHADFSTDSFLLLDCLHKCFKVDHTKQSHNFKARRSLPMDFTAPFVNPNGFPTTGEVDGGGFDIGMIFILMFGISLALLPILYVAWMVKRSSFENVTRDGGFYAPVAT